MPLSNTETKEVTMNIKSANALCVMYGHDFSDDGVCHRKTPNLIYKNIKGSECGEKDIDFREIERQSFEGLALKIPDGLLERTAAMLSNIETPSNLEPLNWLETAYLDRAIHRLAYRDYPNRKYMTEERIWHNWLVN